MPIMLGKYEIKGILANTDVSHVYWGLDQEKNKVAIKVSKEDTEKQIPPMDHRIKVLERISKLTNPNLIIPIDFFQDSGSLVEVTPFIEDSKHLDLKPDNYHKMTWDKWSQVGIDFDRSKKLVTNIANGLAEIHSLGWLHADLHEKNILVTPDFTARVFDYGFTKEPYLQDRGRPTFGGLNNEWSEDRVNENRRFPPEYFDPYPRTIGFTTEVYKVGAYFRELITRWVPSADRRDQMVCIWRYKDIPERVPEIIRKATDHSTSSRYKNCGELLKDLQSL